MCPTPPISLARRSAQRLRRARWSWKATMRSTGGRPRPLCRQSPPTGRHNKQHQFQNKKHFIWSCMEIMMLLPSDACVVSALKLDCKHEQAAQIIRLFLQTFPCQGTAELHAVVQDMDVRGHRALGGTPISTFSATSVCNATARACRRSARRARSARRSCTPS